MKTILLPFNNTEPKKLVMDAAGQIATLFDSYFEGVYYRQSMPIIAGEGITLPGDYLVEFEEEGRLRAEQAALTFERLLREHGIVLSNINDQAIGLRAGWTEKTGSGVTRLGEYARAFDLSIIARATRDDSIDWISTAEAILFESGRPLLVIGDGVPENICEKILVAWNGSTESARALTAAMPFIVKCKELLVVAVEGGTVSGPSAEQVALHIAQRGIKVVAETIGKKDGSVGLAILDQAKSFGASLLIKGAFTHSRLRQLIFGGATREILHHAPLPVLFSH